MALVVAATDQSTLAQRSPTTSSHVIALHCSGSDASDWGPLKRVLSDRTKLWCPNFIGSMWTGHWNGDHAFTLADEAAAIVSMIDALRRPVHLVGHSYGGAVALRVARERPRRIASMVLYEPVALHVLKATDPTQSAAVRELNTVSAAIDRAILAGDHRTAARQFTEYWGGTEAWMRMRNEAQADIIHYMPKAPLDFRAVAFEQTSLSAYRRFNFPVLLLRGQHTREPIKIITGVLAKSLRFCTVQIVDAAGHMGVLTHDSVVANLIASFVERHDDSCAQNESAITCCHAA